MAPRQVASHMLDFHCFPVPQEDVHIDPESALDYVGDGLFTEAELNYTNSNETLAEIQKV